jgi:hypothetical protein
MGTLPSLKSDSFYISSIGRRIKHKSRDFSFIVASKGKIDQLDSKKIGVGGGGATRTNWYSKVAD